MHILMYTIVSPLQAIHLNPFFKFILNIVFFFCSEPNEKSNNENLTESTKNSTQNKANGATEERKDDEDTTIYWSEQINEAFSEYNALWAKYGDKLEKQCKITRDKDTVEHFEEMPKQVLNWIPNWPADKKMEKLLSFRDNLLNQLKRCLAIRGISK